MNLVIGETEYPLLESITGAKLSDLLVIDKESKKLGAQVTIKQLRDYVADEILKAQDGFAPFDGLEHVVTFLSLVYLCRRHAGEDVTFTDGESVEVGQLRLSVTVDDEPSEADPKAPTDSAPGADAAATTT